VGLIRLEAEELEEDVEEEEYERFEAVSIRRFKRSKDSTRIANRSTKLRNIHLGMA
jgi:hypothetical protein|tara:strand:- start:471 stop:638 length:168 start_codon:yes stop_codon:yes gene_type:complete